MAYSYCHSSFNAPLRSNELRGALSAVAKAMAVAVGDDGVGPSASFLSGKRSTDELVTLKVSVGNLSINFQDYFVIFRNFQGKPNTIFNIVLNFRIVGEKKIPIEVPNQIKYMIQF